MSNNNKFWSQLWALVDATGERSGQANFINSLMADRPNLSPTESDSLRTLLRATLTNLSTIATLAREGNKPSTSEGVKVAKPKTIPYL